MELLVITLIGFFIGFLIVVSPGAVMFIAIRLLLYRRYEALMYLIAGAMIGDSAFLFLGALSYTHIIDILSQYKIYLDSITFIVLLITSIFMYLKPIQPHDILKVKENKKTLVGYFTTSLFLVTTNPFTIATILFLLTFISNVAYTPQTYFHAFIFSIGGLIGGVSWWGIAYYIMRSASDTLLNHHLHRFNTILSGLIFCFSLYALYQVVIQL